MEGSETLGEKIRTGRGLDENRSTAMLDERSKALAVAPHSALVRGESEKK